MGLRDFVGFRLVRARKHGFWFVELKEFSVYGSACGHFGVFLRAYAEANILMAMLRLRFKFMLREWKAAARLNSDHCLCSRYKT